MTQPVPAVRRCDTCSAPVAQWRSVDGYRIYENTACGHRMVLRDDVRESVEDLYDDSYFTEGGAGYTDYISGRWALRARAGRYARTVRRAGLAPGRVVEIGSAAGFTLEAFQRAGWQVQGVEANATMACFARQCLGVPTTVGTAEDVDLPQNQDLVLMLQVLEHLRDPRRLLERVMGSLRSGGVVLIETWSLHSSIAKALGPDWHQYSPPTVLNWFSAKSLTRVMNAVGFRLVRTGRPLKLITLQNGLSLVRAKYPAMDTPVVRRIADSAAGRLAVPYPPLDLFWALYRKPENSA